ncbi:MAG: hypothetical protein HY319_19610, partial [Armatimonadetes bacterium]|nr:hypothetical protein [Armatimonadota bacterium]
MRYLPAGCLILLLLAGPLAGGELPRTPVFMVNQKIKLAQVGEKGRVFVDYDVSAVGAQGLKLYLYHHSESSPRKEWHFTAPRGRERVSLNDMPVAVYRMVGVAVDAQGDPIARPALVHVEYGGWRAWEEFEAAERGGPPPPLSEIAPSEQQRQQEGQTLSISPVSAVLKPHDTVEFETRLQGFPAGEEIGWRVEDGDWEESGPGKLLFVAPEVVGSRLIRIRA